MQAIKEEVNRYVEIHKIMINISTLSERIQMECNTNIEIYRRNAIVAKKAIQNGYIENEQELTILLNTAVSDKKLIDMLKEEVGNV